MLPAFYTGRLEIREPRNSDAAFFRELLNSEGWIRFIGDRNVHSDADAVAFIEKIKSSSTGWVGVVCLKETSEAIGIMSYIKREFLPHYDLGFAFLDDFQRKGFAYEASGATLNKIKEITNHSTILANILPENQASIALVEKLGFRFSHTIPEENHVLSIYTYPGE